MRSAPRDTAAERQEPRADPGAAVMRIVAVSPHLDDAAFSVGGTLAALAAKGHSVTVVTCFTASVAAPAGFALACQTDKGIPAAADYMALRRAEDRAAMAVLGAGPVHLPLVEAPHRGYASAAQLFAGTRPGDDAWRDVAQALAGINADVWLAPQALGGHVDHLQTVQAVRAIEQPTAWWADIPYALRDSAGVPRPDLPAQLSTVTLGRDDLARVRASQQYVTQLGFQFGGPQQAAAALYGRPEPLLADRRAAALLREAEASPDR